MGSRLIYFGGKFGGKRKKRSHRQVAMPSACRPKADDSRKSSHTPPHQFPRADSCREFCCESISQSRKGKEALIAKNSPKQYWNYFA